MAEARNADDPPADRPGEPPRCPNTADGFHWFDCGCEENDRD